jgi:hypothetical protein
MNEDCFGSAHDLFRVAQIRRRPAAVPRRSPP